MFITFVALVERNLDIGENNLHFYYKLIGLTNNGPQIIWKTETKQSKNRMMLFMVACMCL